MAQIKNTGRTLTLKIIAKSTLIEGFCDDLDEYFTVLLKSEIMADGQGNLPHRFVTILAEDEWLEAEND